MESSQHPSGWSTCRQRNADDYDAAFRAAGLGAQVATPIRLQGNRHIFNQYIIRTRRRDDLRQALTAAGIGTEIYYPIPLHMQECFAYLDCRSTDFPEAARAAEETLALPIYPELSAAHKQYVVGTIRDFYS